MTTIPAARERGRHRPRRRAGRGPLLLPVVVFAAMTLSALAYVGYVLWPRWPGASAGIDAPALPITVGDVAFNLPPAAIRVPVQRRPGAQERVDLAFLWPSLEPPDPNAKPSPPTPGAAPAPILDRVFVTISAAGDTLHPAERVRNVYSRYTANQASPGPGGLSVVPFRESTPYQGEDLIHDGAVASFFVRCTRYRAGPTPGICLYERRIEAADVVVRFPRDWLDDWPTVAGNIDRLIAKLRPAH